MEQERDPDELDELWRREQLRLGEEAIRGMLSGDFGNGNGEFVEPVRGIDPVDYQLPEDQQLLESALSVIDVSAGIEVEEAPNDDLEEPEADIIDDAFFEEDTDGPSLSDGIEFGRSEDTPSYHRQERDSNFIAGLEGTQQQAAPAPSIDPAPVQTAKAGLSGFHSGVTRKRTREERVEQARQSIESKRAEIANPTGNGATPAAADVAPAPVRSEAAPQAGELHVEKQPASPPIEPPQNFEIDFGSESFFDEPAAGDVIRDQLIGMAVDSVTSKDEMVLEMLRRLLSMTEQNKEGLQRLLDQTDSEEETDDF